MWQGPTNFHHHTGLPALKQGLINKEAKGQLLLSKWSQTLFPKPLIQSLINQNKLTDGTQGNQAFLDQSHQSSAWTDWSRLHWPGTGWIQAQYSHSQAGTQSWLGWGKWTLLHAWCCGLASRAFHSLPLGNMQNISEVAEFTLITSSIQDIHVTNVGTRLQ